MDWGQHIHYLPIRLNPRRGRQTGIPEYQELKYLVKSKEVVYKTLVCPKLEYAAPIWSPDSTGGEGTEDNDLQDVSNARSVGDTCMLDELQWPTIDPEGSVLSAFLPQDSFQNFHSPLIMIRF